MRPFILLSCIILLSASCRKKQASAPVVSSGKIAVNVAHVSGGYPLIFDSLMYTNIAGNRYSVTRLQYYLSGFRFYRNGDLKYSCAQVIYIDAAIDSTLSFNLTEIKGMPAGTYDSIAFYIGIDPAFNISNNLPSTPANVAMGWPDVMGGGYHFLKLEGHWIDSGTISGYAMHIGTNDYLVWAGVRQNITVNEIADVHINLAMDINEWFGTPHIYNFSTDGVFSMGDPRLMRMLADNGADVFRAR